MFADEGLRVKPLRGRERGGVIGNSRKRDVAQNLTIFLRLVKQLSVTILNWCLPDTECDGRDVRALLHEGAHREPEGVEDVVLQAAGTRSVLGTYVLA
jgi:hypothetical protein